MSEIDDVLSESMRRRAAEARLGGGSMADVQQRMIRRRRRVALVTCAALAVPALLAVGVVVGQRSAQPNGVVSAGAALGDAVSPSTLAPPNAPCAFEIQSDGATPAGTVPTPPAQVNVPLNCAVTSSAIACATVSRGSVPGPAYENPATAIGEPPATAIGEPPATAIGEPPATAIGDTTLPAYSPTIDCPPMPEYACSGGVSVSGVPTSLPADAAGTVLPQPPLPSQPPTVIAGTLGTVSPMGPRAAKPPQPMTPHPMPPQPMPLPTVVTSSGGCTMFGPASWRCTDEISSSSTWPGWREFSTCEPLYAVVPGQTSIDVGLNTSTTVVDPPVTTNP